MTHSNVLILVILKIVLIQDLPKKKKDNNSNVAMNILINVNLNCLLV